MSLRPRRATAAAAAERLQRLAADDEQAEEYSPVAKAVKEDTDAFVEEYTEEPLSPPPATLKSPRKRQRANRELSPISYTHQQVLPISRSALPTELKRLIASFLYQDLLDLWHLMLADKTWYKTIAGDEFNWKLHANMLGAKVRKKESDWMQTYIAQYMSACLGCGTKTQAKFPILPDAPKGVHVCIGCQFTIPRFFCIDYKSAKRNYGLSDEDLASLPFKWYRQEGSRYGAKYEKQYLLKSLKDLVQAKEAARQAREAARAQAAVKHTQELANQLAKQETAMLETYSGASADLQAVFDQVAQDRANNRSTLLAAKHKSLIDQSEPSSKDIHDLVQYHQKSAVMEDQVKEACKTKARVPHLSRALITLDTVPGGARAKAGHTWREILVEGVTKDWTAFFAAVKRADTAQKKAEQAGAG